MMSGIGQESKGFALRLHVEPVQEAVCDRPHHSFIHFAIVFSSICCFRYFKIFLQAPSLGPPTRVNCS